MNRAFRCGSIAWRTNLGLIAAVICGALCAMGSAPVAKAAMDDENPLKVFFVDVEGGQATLFVTPDGQSMLIDTGWAGNGGRDADRIVAVARQAGLSRINYVVITHYHDDHVGGLAQLAAKIPIDTVVDHGPNRETGNAGTEKNWKTYQELVANNKFKRLTVKPGDILPIQRIHVTVISADGQLIQSPLPGAGDTNNACKDSQTHPADPTENARSIGLMIQLGNLKVVDLGDLSWAKEMELMCPLNKLGKVNVYIVSHHGWSESGSPALVRGLEPRVAIMDNGAKKGGSPSTWEILRATPHLEDIWQLHFSEEGGKKGNPPEEFIANVEGTDAGNYLELHGNSDGSFSVFNSRTQKTKKYGH